jgi:cytochrome c oxidase subunit 2
MKLGAMKLGAARAVGKFAIGLAMAWMLAAGPAAAQSYGTEAKSSAQNVQPTATPSAAAATPVVATPAPAPTSAAAPGAPAPVAKLAPNTPIDAAANPAGGGYTPMAPTPGKGMPVDGGYGLQKQYSPIGDYGHWFHDIVLMPIIVLISVFVLFLLLLVVLRYNRRSNPTPSKTTHNTVIEVVWTLVPVLILVGIAVPSISLLAKQYKPAPAGALTVKAIGYQWYWGYEYPDNGGFEVISNMLKEPSEVKAGERARTDRDGPDQLAVDNRMVLPAGEPIRFQTTAADVIHAVGVPSLWLKLDAVPGRINEKVLFIEEPGVYFGQCSELCGARHAYMPIVIEALPRPQFEAWVLAQPGGTVRGRGQAPNAVPTAPPTQAPASSQIGAPAAGAPPATGTIPQ